MRHWAQLGIWLVLRYKRAAGILSFQLKDVGTLLLGEMGMRACMQECMHVGICTSTFACVCRRTPTQVMRRRHEDILLDLRSKMLLKQSSSGSRGEGAKLICMQLLGE